MVNGRTEGFHSIDSKLYWIRIHIREKRDRQGKPTESRKEIPANNNCSAGKPEEKEINSELQSDKEPSPKQLEQNLVGTESELFPAGEQEHHHSEPAEVIGLLKMPVKKKIISSSCIT